MMFTFTLKNPEPGDTRVKKGFLFLPVIIKGELRWFTYAERLQVYSAGGTQTGYDYSFAGWKNVEWRDKLESWSTNLPHYHFYSGTLTGQINLVYKELYDC